jgi:transcriptional regulator with XRE-family HTH domain
MMMLHSKTIGEKIANARKKMNISQADLALQVSISPQAVGKWERGESMPDIVTLDRLASIFGVDLNYFSENTPTALVTNAADQEPFTVTTEEAPAANRKTRFDWNWDMSRGNWADADFSGLKNLKEKFSSCNIKNCQFIKSDLMDLVLENNNVELCDFSFSDFRNSKIHASNLLKNQYHNCSFVDATWTKNNIEKCDFTGADFSGTEFSNGNFSNNIISDAHWKFTSFKKMGIDDLVFEGTFEDCHFEGCSFYRVKFQNATLVNTFFKYNDRFKRVQFTDCKVDKITYAFLKNNQANLAGVTLLE